MKARRSPKFWMYKKTPFDWLNIGLLSLLALIVIYPLYNTLLLSLSTEDVNANYPVLLYPHVVNFDNYESILKDATFIRSFLNSVIIVVCGVAYSMFLTVTCAYALSKKKFPGKAFVLNMIIICMFFDGGTIPSYLLVKNLGLISTYAAVILPVGMNVIFMIITRTHFQDIPAELSESAKIDGAGEIRVLAQILLPLSIPIIATFSLFYGVDRWNEWFSSLLYLKNDKLWPVQMYLRQLFSASLTTKVSMDASMKKNYAEGMKMAALFITMFPVMIIYPFLQKYFMKGMLIGAIKS